MVYLGNMICKIDLRYQLLLILIVIYELQLRKVQAATEMSTLEWIAETFLFECPSEAVGSSQKHN